MLRRLRLLFNPSDDRDSPLVQAQETYDHFIDPHDLGEQITSVDQAFSQIDEVTHALQSSRAVGWAEKRLIRRSLPEVRDLRESHATLYAKAEKVRDPAEQRAAFHDADGFAFSELAFYGSQLSGVAEYYAKAGSATPELKKTAETAELLWQTLSNSAVSARIAALHARGGFDLVRSETRMGYREARERLSDWPGTNVSGSTMNGEDWSFFADGVHKRPTQTAAQRAQIERERTKAMHIYGQMSPDRGQIVDALRNDTRHAISEEIKTCKDAKRTTLLSAALKSADSLKDKDPIRGWGAVMAERLVEEGLITNPKARRRLLGIAHVANRFAKRETAFIAQRVDAWRPEKVPGSDIARRVHNVHEGVLERLGKDASKSRRTALAGISKFLKQNQGDTLNPQNALTVTHKLFSMVDPRDAKSVAALHIAEQASERACQAARRKTRDRARAMV